MDNLTLHFADNRTIIPTLEKDSVDCVLTSPPYWGLRDYGTGANSVWDGDPECEHDFNETERRIHGGSVTTAQVGAVLSNAAKTDWVTKEGFCHCGAWKGQLGLEPTWQLFIKHMVEISSLIKRVLKPTGSYYLVMGDTYCAKPKSSNSGGMQNENYGNRHSEHGWENRGEDFKQMIKSDPITKPKQLLLIPSRLAIALQEDGWTLRNKIIWGPLNELLRGDIPLRSK
ncbi:MAG: DNA methyltransferase [Candidatus Thorarchaeota archaeon]|jgi:DNA modification methylase